MLLDNKNKGKVTDALSEALEHDAYLSILSGAFSIYAFNVLKDELKRCSETRILLSKWLDTGPLNMCGNIHELRLQNALDQARIAKECANWVANQAHIKALTNTNLISQNLFHVNSDENPLAIQGSSPFTADGLGAVKSDRYDMNMATRDHEGAKELLRWFDGIWEDKSAVKDIKDDLIQQLQYVAAEKPGELIYFITLYNIFREFLEDIDEENIIRSKTGYKDTAVWNKLYKFQRDGVLGAIDKLEKYNGCIIADSVGLGKTFEALAVIKYYELRNDRVLVLCPKRLRENWTVFTINDKRNILASDRFNYDVLNHTDLNRVIGKSGEINLETLNWGNYDLVVIDESHNFRNNNPKADGVTRYRRLMDDVIRSGVKTKVLMLSATPVNNRMNDLKNQVAFINEGRDEGLTNFGIKSIENTLKKAQTRFNAWLKKDSDERKVEELLESLNFDYFKLLDLLTIARSRKHIEKYYDMSAIGDFPQRLQPKNIKSNIDLEDKFPAPKEINTLIRRLNLGAYSPLEYVRMDKRDEYSRKYDTQVKGGTSVLKQIDREKSLIHLMRVNMLKRMESSINSFALTVSKVLNQINGLLERIEKHETDDVEELNIEDIEPEDPDMEDFLIGRKVKVLIQDMDLVRLKQDLEEDRDRLQDLVDEAEKISAERDAKLRDFKEYIAQKCRNPINDGNKKVVVFTAFSDTAYYLYEHIAHWAQKELGLNAALLTGAGGCKTTLKTINKDFNAILTNFSPVSKERASTYGEVDGEIDILIATDCISEGQNLQDCDTLINYDIHWNPVRIIQRFGRIDRLGSKNKAVQLVNFWPNMELDEYINLEARVSGRMVLLDISATGEENVIEYDEKKQMNDLEYRRKQLMQLQETVVDLEDMSGGVSITDMTLNDFRMDLSSYMKDHLDTLENSPTGFYAVSSREGSEAVPGVIFCLRDVHNKIDTNDSYALAPHYLVYVAEDGEIVLNHYQAKKSLDILKKLYSGKADLDQSAIDAFNRKTKKGKDMSTYQFMLERAINSIVGKTEEKGVESLFERGGTALTQDHFRGIEDFEVVSYAIIQEAA